MANRFFKKNQLNSNWEIGVTDWSSTPSQEILDRVLTKDPNDYMHQLSSEITNSNAFLSIDGRTNSKELTGSNLYLNIMNHTMNTFTISFYTLTSGVYPNNVAEVTSERVTYSSVTTDHYSRAFDSTSYSSGSGIVKINIQCNSWNGLAKIGHVYVGSKSFDEPFDHMDNQVGILPRYREVSRVMPMFDGSFRKINVTTKRDFSFDFVKDKSHADYYSWTSLRRDNLTDDFFFMYDTDNFSTDGKAGYFFLSPDTQIGEQTISDIPTNPAIIKGSMISSGGEY